MTIKVASNEDFVMHIQGGPKKNNTETNQNDTDTNDIFGTNSILCKDIK